MTRLSLDVRVNGRRTFSRDAAGPAPLYLSRALEPECARALADYAPHVTVAGQRGTATLDSVPAYPGELVFGPETFAPLRS